MSVSTLSDESLVAHYRKGNANAFTELVRRHQKGLFNFVCRQIRTTSAAEEIVQEVFVRIVQNIHSFKEEARFTTWAYTIARNLCIDHMRKKAHRRHASLDTPENHEESSSLAERIPSQELNPERNTINEQLQKHIQLAVEQLPDDQREVFLLRQMGNLSFKEIAEIVNVGENTIKSRMRYALERLQIALTEFEDYAKSIQ